VVGAEETTLLRPGEVAAIFGVNSKTVVRWARDGRLRCIRTPGGHMRIYAEDVRALVAQMDEPADVTAG
jgi:excisionase family DNA binding protein